MAIEYETKDREGDKIVFTHYNDGDVIIRFTSTHSEKEMDMWFNPDKWEDFCSIVEQINRKNKGENVFFTEDQIHEVKVALEDALETITKV